MSDLFSVETLLTCRNLAIHIDKKEIVGHLDCSERL